MSDTTTNERVITSVEELKSLVGQELGVSDWLEITQERVNTFADATGDHQYIHVDPERAATTFFGGTVAHGFLTLSLIPRLASETLTLPPARMTVNYGLNRVRFPAPLPVGSRVRMRMKLASVDDVPGGAQFTTELTFEREGADKPVCVAESLARVYTAG